MAQEKGKVYRLYVGQTESWSRDDGLHLVNKCDATPFRLEPVWIFVQLHTVLWAGNNLLSYPGTLSRLVTLKKDSPGSSLNYKITQTKNNVVCRAGFPHALGLLPWRVSVCACRGILPCACAISAKDFPPLCAKSSSNRFSAVQADPSRLGRCNLEKPSLFRSSAVAQL